MSQLQLSNCHLLNIQWPRGGYRHSRSEVVQLKKNERGGKYNL